MAVDNRTENRNYPLPDPTNLLNEDVERLIAALEAIDGDIAGVASAVAEKADAEHEHEIVDVIGLQDALDSKAASNHEHGLNDLIDVDVSEAANGQFLKRVGTKWSPASVQIGDVSGLQTALETLGAAGPIVILKGTWDASTGSFPGSGAAKAGWSYIVSESGTVDGVEFTKNDRIVAITDDASTSTYAGNWHKLDYTDQVLSVAGRTGEVTLGLGDVSGLETALDGKQDDLGLVGIADGADFRAGTTDDKALTPKAAYDASDEVTLTYANPLVIDFSQGTNFKVVLVGSPVIQAVGLEHVSGKMGRIRFIQDANGAREPTWNSAFVFSGGEAPEFSSSAGAEDRAYYDICDGKVYIAFVEDVK